MTKKFDTPYANKVLSRWLKTHDQRDRAILCELHTPLVVSIAAKYATINQDRIPLADIVQEGYLGLLKALDLFDPTKGASFPTYSAIWILARIRRYIAKNRTLVKYNISSHVRALDPHFVTIASKCRAQNPFLRGEELFQAISKTSGINVESVRVCAASRSACASLDAPIQNTEELTMGQTIPCQDSLGLEDKLNSDLDADKIKQRVRDITSNLDARQARILQARIIADVPVTLRELGKEFGLTRERVRQLETKTLKYLRVIYKLRYAA
jgi:RNA polymerase sigma-32 factor